MIFGLIPIVAWLGVSGWLVGRGWARTWREGFLQGALLAGGWLVAGTEGLGAMGVIRFWPLVAWWGVPAVVFGVLAFRGWKGLRGRIVWPERWRWEEGALLLVVVFCLGWSWTQAFCSAPETPDALTYHLPRQVHWLQQGSVANYATSNLRQLTMPPMAEYAGLHLMVLTGSDRGNNLVQWMAFLLTMMAVSLIVRRYGGSRLAELVAVVWVATFPMVFLQASSAKNDDVVALWCATSLYFVLELEEGFAWGRMAWIGLGFGAMVLTKGTGMIFGLPLGLLMVWMLVRRDWRRAAGGAVLVAVIAGAMNEAFLLRNYRGFGSLVPNDPAIHGGDVVTNQDYSMGAIASNMLRNIGPHLVLPWNGYDEALTRGMEGIHGWLGRDINDPRTTYALGRFKGYGFIQSYEDEAAAPAHLFVLLWLPVALVLGWRRIPRGAVMVLIGITAVDFVLFSTLLKWQVWHVRLIVPMAVVLAPVIGWAWMGVRVRGVAVVVAGVLVVGLVPSLNTLGRELVGGESIFVKGREASRFGTRPYLKAPDEMIVQALAKARPGSVGFDGGWNFEEYLIERMLMDRMGQMDQAPRFMAFNASYQVPGEREGDPDIVISEKRGATLVHESTGLRYVAVATEGIYTVYVNPERVRVKGAEAQQGR